MVLIKNVNIVKGKGKEILFTCLDNNGVIIDLTGLTGSLNVVRENPEVVDTAILTKSLVLVSADEGKCKVTLTDSDTTIDANQYIYYLTVTFDTGENRVLYSGDFIVNGDDLDNRIKQIKKVYGLSYEYYVMKEALDYARVEVKNNAFENVINDITSNSATIKICHNVMDNNFDGSIDENDFNVFQYMKATPYTVEDLNAHIVSISQDNPSVAILTLDAAYPDSGYVLRAEYNVGSDSQANLQKYINKLEEWYVIKYLFENLDVYKLQHGMTTKDINGISIVYDQEGISTFQKKIIDNITYYLMKTKPFNKCKYNNKGTGGLIRSILIPKSYD